MPKKTFPKKNRLTLSIFELMFLVWSGIVLVSIILAILGIFYPFIIGLYFIGVLFWLWRLQQQSKIIIKFYSTKERILLTGLILWVSFLSAFTVPTIFGGRDEGSLSTSAFLINQDHSLSHQSKSINTFAKIYGEGKALNFPGFFYQKNGTNNFVLRSQFLPGYSSYLANFAYSSKVNLLKFANALPLIIFLLAFFSVSKQITKSDKFSFLAVIGLATTIPLALFYKFTLSEIFFASLLWPGLYFLIKYLQNSSKNFELILFWFIFIPLLPTVFIRIESFAIIFILVLILILKKHSKLHLPKYQIPILLIILLSVVSIVLFNNFFVATLKGFFSSLLNANPSTSENLTAHSLIPKMWQNFYALKVFYIYNLIPFFVLGVLGIIKLFREKKWLYLMPAFLLGVTGIYFIDANISLDHPWMLRRFVFTLIPLGVLYTIVLFQRYPLRQKRISNLILTVLIVSNVLMVGPFITFKQNDGLLNQVKLLSTKFQANDLVLVSQKSSGSGWSLISAPLRTVLQKQAVYFFNPNDFAKIDINNYNHIYLITSKEEIPLYKQILSLSKIKKKENYSLQNQYLEPTKNPLQFPKTITTKTSGVIYKLK